jgi:hypothetical protein
VPAAVSCVRLSQARHFPHARKFAPPQSENDKLEIFCKVEHHFFAVTVVDGIISDKFLGHSAITQK